MSRRQRRLRSFGSRHILLGFAFLAPPCAAQEAALPRLAEIETVTVEEGADLDVSQRHRPELDPVGYGVGAWRIYPSIRASAGWDSNLYGVETSRTSAAFGQIEPAVSARLESSRMDVSLDASGRFARFAGQEAAAENSYRFAGAFRRDLSTLSSVEAGAEFEQLVERREASEFPGGRVAPSTFLRTRLYAIGRYQTGRFGAVALLDYTAFDYRDTDALDLDGNAVGRIDQDARDERTLRGSLRGEFSFGPGIGLFVQGVAASIDYRKDEIFPGVPNPTGSEYTALAGLVLRPNSLFEGSVGAGYLRRNYRAGSLRDIGGLAINAEVKYFVTPLVTLAAEAARTIEEAALQDRRGYVSEHFGIRADYELLRSLIISARAGYQHNDFRSSARVDKIVDLGASARYQANRTLGFDAEATYVNRNVDGDPFATSFREFRIQFGIRYSL